MTALLDVQSISKSFGGLKALQDVHFSVDENEIFAVIGPNGAGKTTLFNCLSGALHPDSGQILFEGERIEHLPPHTICKRGLARTFQIVKPFRGMTVLENVQVAAFAKHKTTLAARKAAAAVLEELDIASKAYVDAGELNVSELRSLEIARALATEPRLLLLDEMLAGLTKAEADALCAKIRLLPSRGIAVIVVEHSVPVISSLCERSVVIDFGQVLLCGPTAEVIKDERVQGAYLGKVAS
ncbi:ABC transporter ATP-binding protein [Kordiimonas pumila]|uniref:ABC transporter ATP-binding protein n=1 Tax=Kordiimonas pumila TaxID=2161677 RepID=A0ABV7D4E8_9PROT|nr:ABC transporter ATP-binding protein [Kordiimonas pumila]